MWVDDEFFGDKWQRWEGSDWPTDNGVPECPAYPCTLTRHRVALQAPFPAPESVREPKLRAFLEAAQHVHRPWVYQVFVDRPTVPKPTKAPVDIYDRARRAAGERESA